MLPASSRPRRSPPSRGVIFAALLAAGTAIVLALLLSHGRPAAQVRADCFVSAWARNDYEAMRAELAPADQRRTSLRAFVAAYRQTATTATIVSLRPGESQAPKGGVVSVPMTVVTRAFGPVQATLALPIAGEGDDVSVNWGERLTFPGVARGERLVRHTQLPRRADILARDGTPLAQGPDRTSPLGPIASSIVGELGPVAVERVADLRARGFPDDARVEITGLERVFDDRVAGRPGGLLQA